MVSPSQKRRAIKHVIEQGKGTTAEACRAMNLQRSTYYRNSTVRPERQEMERASLISARIIRAMAIGALPS